MCVVEKVLGRPVERVLVSLSLLLRRFSIYRVRTFSSSVCTSSYAELAACALSFRLIMSSTSSSCNKPSRSQARTKLLRPKPRVWTCRNLLLTVAQTNNSPPAAPSPLASATVSATAFGSPELLVLALGQTNDDVGFDGAEREDPQTRAGAERADGCGEGGGWVPESL
jgi:hypothetical protein